MKFKLEEKLGPQFSLPWCARCQGFVERVERHVDVFTGDVVYTIHCHNAVERQVVPGLDLHDVTMINSCG